MSLIEKEQRSANAVGGKTARACDSCMRRRARWYCAADDAFLCQACDASVHSANPLARRHDRVRLKTASSSTISASTLDSSIPTWHQGFKRKARTPRPHHHHGKPLQAMSKPMPLVPDLENNTNSNDDELEEVEEDQLLYRVPIFDPVLAEFCSPPCLDDDTNPISVEEFIKPEVNSMQDYNCNGLVGFTPTDMELAEFAADVESLLGQGLGDDPSFSIDDIGLIDDAAGRVKTELDGADMIIGGSSNNNNVNYHVDMEMEFSRESLDINFDCGSPTIREEIEEQKIELTGEGHGAKMFSLRLDYEAVITAWSSKGCSPWADGERPQFNLNDCWPDFMGTWGGEVQDAYGEMGMKGHMGAGDGGREARVTRYREKRRTRLFSKKIRYEVRKLNAEKRPRMKGRFVKRSSFPAALTAPGFTY